MFMSLTIGGLNTGDLWPNATLYNEDCTDDPTDCRFDEFFATFTQIQHSESIFMVFMYDEGLDRMLGAKRYPDDDGDSTIDSTKIVIINYDGDCRRERLYNVSSRTRIPEHDPSLVDQYENCTYSPQSRYWLHQSTQLGVGRAVWTEPYMYIEGTHGMTYVAPIEWKGRNLTFVVGVTMQTLAIGISTEITNLPDGSLWMVVTPGFSMVSSSNNETFINGEWECRQSELTNVCLYDRRSTTHGIFRCWHGLGLRC